jgi:hypothetical protein
MMMMMTMLEEEEEEDRENQFLAEISSLFTLASREGERKK